MEVIMNILSLQTINNQPLKNPEIHNNSNLNFQDFLKQAISEVNDMQISADSQAIGFAAGQPNIDIHEVMIGMEQAHLALQLTIEVRNKVVEAYQEIMRMQL